MKRVNTLLGKILDIGSGEIPAWLVFAMIWLVLIEVVSRYVFVHPLRVSDEFSAYLMVIISLVGAAYTWKEKGHVRIDSFISFIPAKIARRVRIVTLFIALVFLGIFIKASYDMVAYSAHFSQRSPTHLMVPQAPIQVFIFIGLILLFVAVLIETIKTIKKPQHKSEVVS